MLFCSIGSVLIELMCICSSMVALGCSLVGVSMICRSMLLSRSSSVQFLLIDSSSVSFYSSRSPCILGFVSGCSASDFNFVSELFSDFVWSYPSIPPSSRFLSSYCSAILIRIAVLDFCQIIPF